MQGIAIFQKRYLFLYNGTLMNAIRGTFDQVSFVLIGSGFDMSIISKLLLKTIEELKRAQAQGWNIYPALYLPWFTGNMWHIRGKSCCPHQVSSMVIILDGNNSEIGAELLSEIGGWICLRPLFRSGAVANFILM